MINVATAEQLLDFRGARLDHRGSGAGAARGRRGPPQHPRRRSGVAYLADEVGMGKTTSPSGRWRSSGTSTRLSGPGHRSTGEHPAQVDEGAAQLRPEQRAVRRPAGEGGRTAAGAADRACQNLVELVREASLNPDRDFFIRLSSFSLPLGKDAERMAGGGGTSCWSTCRGPTRRDLRPAPAEAFKDNFAKAVCAALPVFDLVIVDEGHNLKHGFSDRVRRATGSWRWPSGIRPRRARFPGYGPRANASCSSPRRPWRRLPPALEPARCVRLGRRALESEGR